MVRGTVNIFKCIDFFSFLHLHVCKFSFPSLCPSIYGAAFERMFTSRCLCDHYKKVHDHSFIELMSPSLYFLFVLLNCNCSLSSAHSLLALQVSFYLLRGSNSFPALNRTFLFFYKRRVAIPAKDNQVTRSEVILLYDPTEKCPWVSFRCLWEC